MRSVLAELKRLYQSSLVRNAGWMFAGQGFSIVCQAIYFLLIGRLLGSREYGIYVGVVAMVAIISQYSSLGTHSVFVRYISSAPKEFPFYWGNILATTLILGSVLVMLLTFLGPRFAPSYTSTMVFNVALADCICAQLTFAIGRIFQAFERLAFTASLSLMVNFLRALLAGALLLTIHHGTAMEWSTAVLIVSVVAAAISVILVLRLHGAPQFSWSLLRRRTGEGFVFALSFSTTGIYNDVDKALLGHNGMNVANGIYSMAYRVVDVGTMPVLSVQSAAFPRFFRKGVGGVRHTYDFCIKIVKRTSVVALVTAVMLFLTAPIIPRLMGRDFAESVTALRWLCLLPLFRSFQLAAGDAVTGAGYQKLRLGAQATAAGFNLVANLYLIPRYSWRGAAWSSLATDGLLALFNWLVLLCLLRSKNGDEQIDDFDEGSPTRDTGAEAFKLMTQELP